MSCRTYGPPVRIGGERLAPCRLCFVGASAAEVERCRIEIDPEGLEDRRLDELHAVGFPNGEKLVAFVLAPAGTGAGQGEA